MSANGFKHIGRNSLPGAFLIVAAVMAVAAGVMVSNAGAHDYKLGAISIGHIWSPPTSADAEGAAVYGPLLNRGGTRDYLLSATSPMAETVRFRQKTDNGSEWLDKIALDPNKPVSLADWRTHIWLEGLKKPLKKGADFPLTLEFAKAGSIDVTVVVEEASGH